MRRYPRGFVISVIAGMLVAPTMVATQSGDDGRLLPGKEWTLTGGDWTNARYSTLSQINQDTIKDLGAAWTRTFEDGATSRSTPVVKDGLLFVTAGASVYALDAKSGETVWAWRLSQAQANVADTMQLVEALNTGLAVPSPPGVALGEGLVFVGLMDGRVVALTQKDGELVWSQQIGEQLPRRGQSVSGAPTYARGFVFAGLANGDWGLRGKVVALEAKTGKKIWEFFVIPGPGEFGHETWPQDNEVWKQGGGGVWQVGTVDTELGMVYFGTGNTVPQTGGEIRAGDNLFTNSVVALDMKTGKLRWHYQVVRHDLWDSDIPTPLVLYDAQVGGRPRKALAAMRPDGYLFLLDRKTGTPIFPVEERPVTQNAWLHTAATQPFPVGADRLVPECDTWRDKVQPPFVLDCPGFAPPSFDKHNVLTPGVSVRVTPMSFSPQTGYFYALGSGSLMRPRRISNDPWFWGSGGTAAALPPSVGVLAAIDSRTNKIVWKKEGPPAVLGVGGSGPLTTAGGLMFRGTGGGNVEAYDAKTGERLWQFQTGVAGGRGSAATYEIDGEQHIALALGPAMWTFKLGGTVPPQPAPRLRSSGGEFAGVVENTNEIETASLITPCCVTGGHRYAVDEYAFKPLRARVRVGTTVTFVNNGSVVHTIAARDGSWSTGALHPAQDGHVTFDTPGTFTYVCKDHPWSVGQIVVLSANAGADDRSIERVAAGRGGAIPTRLSHGVYTEDQARRGKAQYAGACGSCHGGSLAGGGQMPALAGGEFLMRWDNRTIGELFERIRTSMPYDAPGSLSSETYIDIVAFLLEANSFPAGPEGLRNDLDALKSMTISSNDSEER